jgi:hypothetical protein
MTELDGAREGVRAEGTRAKEELRKHSSKSARSSLTDGEEDETMSSKYNNNDMFLAQVYSK